MKNNIKLTETQLKNVVNRVAKKMLNERQYNINSNLKLADHYLDDASFEDMECVDFSNINFDEVISYDGNARIGVVYLSHEETPIDIWYYTDMTLVVTQENGGFKFHSEKINDFHITSANVTWEENTPIDVNALKAQNKDIEKKLAIEVMKHFKNLILNELKEWEEVERLERQDHRMTHAYESRNKKTIKLNQKELNKMIFESINRLFENSGTLSVNYETITVEEVPQLVDNEDGTTSNNGEGYATMTTQSGQVVDTSFTMEYEVTWSHDPGDRITAPITTYDPHDFVLNIDEVMVNGDTYVDVNEFLSQNEDFVDYLMGKVEDKITENF